MTQNFMHADNNKWWCALCPENYNTSPGISGSTHFEMCHTIEELYDPNGPPFRGS